ncbi:hypothetical protein CLOP_g21267 [Closterium sp. NIES-67]|nr:hypothetical protein CLOP_g21267 [Closterium sp. NIES-67]
MVVFLVRAQPHLQQVVAVPPPPAPPSIVTARHTVSAGPDTDMGVLPVAHERGDAQPPCVVPPAVMHVVGTLSERMDRLSNSLDALSAQLGGSAPGLEAKDQEMTDAAGDEASSPLDPAVKAKGKAKRKGIVEKGKGAIPPLAPGLEKPKAIGSGAPASDQQPDDSTSSSNPPDGTSAPDATRDSPTALAEGVKSQKKKGKAKKKKKSRTAAPSASTATASSGAAPATPPVQTSPVTPQQESPVAATPVVATGAPTPAPGPSRPRLNARAGEAKDTGRDGKWEVGPQDRSQAGVRKTAQVKQPRFADSGSEDGSASSHGGVASALDQTDSSAISQGGQATLPKGFLCNICGNKFWSRRTRNNHTYRKNGCAARDAVHEAELRDMTKAELRKADVPPEVEFGDAY